MTSSPSLSVIRTLDLFRGLPREQLAQLQQSLLCEAFPPNTQLLTMHEVGDSLYILLEGTIKIYAGEGEGSTVIYSLVGPGEILGELNAIDGEGFSAHAVTVEPCVVVSMKRALFLKHLQTMPGLALNIARILARRLRFSSGRIYTFATATADRRLARLLLDFADRYHQGKTKGHLAIPLRLTQSDLASMVGVSRAHVNRTLSTFKEERIIAIDNRQRVTILKPAALRKLA